MKTIQKKIAELLQVSAVEVNYEKGFDALGKKMEKQEALIDELEELARAENTILGRTIKFPCADSHALYVITKINKQSVIIDWIDWCDGWVDDRCGKRASLDLRYATQHVKGNDALAELFKKRKQTAL